MKERVRRVMRSLQARLQIAWEGASGQLEREAPALWVAEEARFRRRMRSALKPSLSLSRRIEALSYDMIRSTYSIADPPVLFRAHATLAVRALQDLRVVGTTALNGYIMQSWTVAASAFEAANMMGYLAKDPARAQRWLEHRQVDKSFANVKDTIRGTLIYLEIGSDQQEREDLLNREYQVYSRACMAKHVHPIAEKNRYWVPAQNGTRLLFTPFWTPQRANLARLGLALANRAAVTATWVYAKTHATAYSDRIPEFAQLAFETVEALAHWKEEPA